MLRVGLTGGLGSGKSTVGAMLRTHGARTMEADAIGRELMQPGSAVYDAIVERFGRGVVLADGALDRVELARLAFGKGLVEDLNAIVHPAVIARQVELTEEIVAREPEAVVVVESALIFETRHAGGVGWRRRFDRIVLVTAPDEVRVERCVTRALGGRRLEPGEPEALRSEARRRMAQQISDAEKERWCDFVVHNDGSMAKLEEETEALWTTLRMEARTGAPGGGG